MSINITKKPVTVTAERYGDPDTGEWDGPEAITRLVAFIRDIPLHQVATDSMDGYIATDRWFDPDDGKYALLIFDAVVHHKWLPLELGQWVIRGVKGEIYPCGHDVLLESYDIEETG